MHTQTRDPASRFVLPEDFFQLPTGLPFFGTSSTGNGLIHTDLSANASKGGDLVSTIHPELAERVFGVFEDDARYAGAFEKLVGGSNEKPRIVAALVESIVSTLAHRDSMLDVGAGTGFITTRLGAHFAEVTAVEPNKELYLKWREDQPGGRCNSFEFLPGRLQDVQPPQGYFDFVLGSHVLYHWPHADWFNAVQNLAKYTAPEGQIGIVLSGDGGNKAELIRDFGGTPIDIAGLIDRLGQAYGTCNIRTVQFPTQIHAASLSDLMDVAGIFLNDAKLQVPGNELAKYLATRASGNTWTLTDPNTLIVISPKCHLAHPTMVTCANFERARTELRRAAPHNIRQIKITSNAFTQNGMAIHADTSDLAEIDKVYSTTSWPTTVGSFGAESDASYSSAFDIMRLSTREKSQALGIMRELILPTQKQFGLFVDIGPGRGENTRLVGNLFSSVATIEPDQQFRIALEQAFEQSGLPHCSFDSGIQGVKLPEGCADLITAFHSFYHVERSGWKDQAEVLFRNLTPGGRLVIILSGENSGKADLITAFGGKPVDISGFVNELHSSSVIRASDGTVSVLRYPTFFDASSARHLVPVAGIFLNDAGVIVEADKVEQYIQTQCRVGDENYSIADEDVVILLEKPKGL